MENMERIIALGTRATSQGHTELENIFYADATEDIPSFDWFNLSTIKAQT